MLHDLYLPRHHALERPNDTLRCRLDSWTYARLQTIFVRSVQSGLSETHSTVNVNTNGLGKVSAG